MPDDSQPTRGSGWGLLTAASCLLLLLAAAQGYVSFRAQYAFVDHAKHARLPSMLEALGLDTGAVIFALLALTLLVIPVHQPTQARRRRPDVPPHHPIELLIALAVVLLIALAVRLVIGDPRGARHRVRVLR